MSGHILEPEDEARLAWLEGERCAVIGSGHWSMVTDEEDGRVIKRIKARKFLDDEGASMWAGEKRNFEILTAAYPKGVKGLPCYEAAGIYNEESPARKAGFFGWIAMEKMPGCCGVPEDPAGWRAYWEKLLAYLEELSVRLNASEILQAHFPAPKNYILIHLSWAQALFQKSDPIQNGLAQLRPHIEKICAGGPSIIMHADPNAGNVLMDGKGGIALVDLSALAREMPEWIYQYCIGAPGQEIVPDFIEDYICRRGHNLERACLVGAVHQFWHVAFDYRTTKKFVDWDRHKHEKAAINACLARAGLKIAV